MNVKLLKNRTFALLMAGQFVSSLGSRMEGFALSLYVLAITGSAAKFASVIAITMIPSLILGPFAGVLVDWVERKRLLILIDCLNGSMTCLTLFMLIVFGQIPLAYIYVASIYFSLTGLLYGPTASTVLPSVIEKEQLLEANSMMSVLMSTLGLIAPILSGALYGIFGLGPILIFNAGSFFFSALCDRLMKLPHLEKKSTKMTPSIFKKNFIEGLAFMKNNKTVFSITMLGMILNFAYTPIMTVGIVVIIKQTLLATDAQFGFFQSCLVVCGMIAPLIVGTFLKEMPLGKLFYYNLMIVAGLFATLALTLSPLCFAALNSRHLSIVIMGGIIGLVVIIISSGNLALGALSQKAIPLELMGRVNTCRTALTRAIIPLGQLIFGFLLAQCPAWICVFITATLLFFGTFCFRTVLKSEDQDISPRCAETLA